MAAQQLSSALTLRDTSVLLAKSGVPLGFGGRIFCQIPELSPRISGEFLGETVGIALDRIGQLLEQAGARQVEGSRVREPETPMGSSSFVDAFRLDRRLLESALAQRLSSAGMGADELEVANFHFGNAIIAALELGNMAYVEGDLDWIRNLLARQGAPVESLRAYLTAFSQVIQEHMGKTSAEVANWLGAYTSRM
jgi:hypothetical protein